MTTEFVGPVTLPSGATTQGRIRVSAANPLPVTGAITGVVTATADALANAVAPNFAEGSTNPLSSNLAGWLRTLSQIDQSNPGTTNAVDATNFPFAVDVNSGNKSNSTLRVVLATDQPAQTNAQPKNITQIAGNAVAATGANVPGGTLPVQDADGYSPGAQSVAGATTIFSLDTTGFASVVIQTTSLGTGCSVGFEGSNDNSNWALITGNYLQNVGITAAATGFSSNFASPNYAIPALTKYVRARCSVYGSGTVTIVPVLRKNPSTQTITAAVNVTGYGTFGAVLPPADTVLRASAAATASYTSADQTNSSGARGISVVLDITAVTTGTATLAINAKDPASGKYMALLTGAALSGTGTARYVIYPGGGAVAANLSANDNIGRVFQVAVTKSDGSSWTFSVGYTLLA